MADSINNIEDFESLLRDKNIRQPLSIYGNEKQQKYIVEKTVHSYSAQDVISNVTSALKALQTADCVKNDKNTRISLEKYKKCSFLPVTLLPVPTDEPKPSTSSCNKFETQCVSDTQLIDMVTNAEAIININSPKGITQEFETTFFEAPANMKSIVDEKEISPTDVMKSDLNAAQIEYSDVKEGIHNSITKIISKKTQTENGDVLEISQDILNASLMLESENCCKEEDYKIINNNKVKNQCIPPNIICDIEEKNVTLASQVFSEYEEMEPNCKGVVFEEIERPTSPVFKRQTKKLKTSQHLVVSLDAFEKFEKIAVPLLSYNDVVDFDSEKHIINSQILGTELLIQPESDIQIVDAPPSSPILTKQQWIRKAHKDRHIDFNKNNCSEVEEKIYLKSNEGLAKDTRNCHTPMSSASEILKDELLFSSDEEADYVHKDVQDLPFTCALETSFYANQSEILDETMFVGFQTASNKSIQISTYSFDMAKSVFEDIEKKTSNKIPISLTQLVEQCDNQMGGMYAENEPMKEKNRQMSENISSGTESKSISVADKAIAKTTTVFQDLDTQVIDKRTRFINKTIDSSICEENNEIIRHNTASNTCIKASDKALSRVNYIFRDENFHSESPIEPNCKVTSQQHLQKINVPSEKSMKFTGLKTASNKNRNISANGFKDSHKAFEDVENLMNIDVTENVKSFQKRKQASSSVVQSELLHKSKTASNQNKYVKECKDISILDSCGQDLYKKIDIENDDDLLLEEFDTEVKFSCDNSEKEPIKIKSTNTSEEHGFKGFKTANNKQTNMSEQALFKTKVIFQDSDSVNETDNIKAMHINIKKNNEQTACIGFKTASNKVIKISKQALAKTENVFQDIDNILEDVISASEKVKQLENSAQNNHFNMQDPKAFEKEPVFTDYQTASKNELIDCEQSLVKTKNIFQDIATESILAQTIDMNTVADPSYQNVSKNMDQISEEASPKSKVDKIDDSHQKSSCFVGFQTASNKIVKISEKALEKTKHIFEGIVKDVDTTQKVDNSISKSKSLSFRGFQTASNKQVNVSEEALTKTKKIFQVVLDKEIALDEDISKGFGGETVKVSEKALAETKNIFHEMNEGYPTKNDNIIAFAGFKTASDKKITISEEALAKSKNIFQDFENDGKNNETTEFSGFQTANNKKVAVSGDALARTKEIFHDIGEVEHEPLIGTDASKGFCGFQTASNKKVAISEQALSKIKTIFQDISLSQIVNLKIDTPAKKLSNFTGFQTANKKKVEITVESLAKTRNIFKDIDETQDTAMGNFETKIVGFKSGNNNKIPIIEDASKGFGGFQTASNKKVAISEQALSKTKTIFQDIGLSQIVDSKVDTPATKLSTFTGLQTTSEKKVEITDESLVKTRSIFKHIDEAQDFAGVNIKTKIVGFKSGNNNKIPIIEDASKGFGGFQTASNKKVAISEQALSKTKTIFQDIGLSQIVDSKVDTPATKLSTFTGLQTTSEKKVEITDESLVKTRSIFKDIDEAQDFARVNIKTKIVGFKSGSNNKITISEDALLKSQKAFNNSTEDYKVINDSNIEKELITTQVLNNFEETLNTEDFCKSPNIKKRPGSPILSCPKAKKRKCFQTPYKVKTANETPKTISATVKKPENIMVLNNNYKKKKILALKDIQLLEKSSDSEANIDPYLLNLNFEELLEFKFSGTRNNISKKKLSTEDLKTYFLESVNKNIVPDGWLDNHLMLILWKLISYEIKFPKSMANACNARNVVEQLKYRYDRELYNVERPVLRKIFEKDDTSARTMVLCVVSILVDGKSVTSVTNHTAIELLLTDGWYTIKASVDRMLTQLVCDGKIVVGCKLVLSGAEMVGCEQGVAPWEDTSAVRLKVSGNSTRLARWDARLGRHGNAAIMIPWSTVRADGGRVSKSRVLITRVYPSLYVHKYEDGSTVTRSERLEQIFQVKFEAERQTILEKLYEEVETEIAQQDSEDSDTTSQGCSSKRKCMESGSQIAKIMKKSKDPQEFRSNLSETQVRLLSEHTTKQREKLLKDIEMRMQEKLEKSGLNEARNVISLLKIRVAGIRETGGKVDVTKGILSIWKPSDAILEILQEGSWIDVMNVVPTAQRNSEIQVSAGRQSTFSRAKVKETNKIKALTKCLSRTCTDIKDIVQNPNLNTDYNEIDTVGLIYLIEPTNQKFEMEFIKNQHFQNMFLTDADKNMLCVNFWGGIKKFGFENILDTGQFVACINLQKRIGNTKKNIPQYRVTEFTYFTKTPKNVNARNRIDELVKKFNGIDRRKFCQDCVELKNNFNAFKHLNTENVSPYIYNNTGYNLSKNKIFIDSPLLQKAVTNRREIEDLNLTGLDFESTFKQKESQDLSPEEIERKKRVNAKIAKLKMYGEPPPLSPIHIINKSKNASKSYKSPLIAKQNLPKESLKTTITVNYPPTNSVISMPGQILPQQSPITSFPSTSKTDEFVSPVVSVNRTYVKRGVNPIKLNFSNNQEEESNNVDHFAEEFDSSPPLSLD